MLYGHVFRNAMLIIIAGFPAAFIGILFTGSLLIEVIFSLDGMGLLSYEAVIKRDYPTNTVLISGHTDGDPIKKSKWADNLELSLQRAAAVHRFLHEQGADPTRMHVVGKGQWHPQSTKKKSRRVEIEVAFE